MSCSRRRSAILRALPRAASLALLTVALRSVSTSFAVVTPPAGASQSNAPLCGRQGGMAPIARPTQGRTATAAAATLSWIDPRKYLGNQQVSPADRLSSREWLRMYRTLGIPPDSSREQVQRATTRLRKKYVNNEAAIEKIESANLWIMTRMMQRKEEEVRARQAANRLREIGNSPKRIFQKYVAGYLPPSIRQMFEAPDTKHFRTTSGLLGVFALLGLCVPTQATNFVGLGAAASLGLIYQRNRPEPVKDEFGNAGAVQKLNYKEMGASIGAVALGVLGGVVLSVSLSYFIDTPFPAIFCLTTCSVLWVISLFLKVYDCFDANAE